MEVKSAMSEEIGAEDQKNRKTIRAIAKNYKQWEKSIVEQLQFDIPNHGTSIGSYRETLWMEFFRTIIPRKFSIEQSVFILDSHGKVSREVDLAIYDEGYTPYIFCNGSLKYIPVEAVAAVVECKSQDLPRESLEDWLDSIEKLHTSSDFLVRFATDIIRGNDKNYIGAQTATRPLRILCHISDGNHKIESKFDFVIKPQSMKQGIQGDGLDIKISPQMQSLAKCFVEVNHRQYEKQELSKGQINKIEVLKGKLGNRNMDNYVIKENEKVLSVLSFVFQFNQLLMLINNPLPFPHLSYVKMFNDNLEDNLEGVNSENE